MKTFKVGNRILCIKPKLKHEHYLLNKYGTIVHTESYGCVVKFDNVDDVKAMLESEIKLVNSPKMKRRTERSHV